MTYRQFLVFGLAPGTAVIATLLIARIGAAGEPAAGRVRRAAAVVLGLAVGAAVYTTPWDGWMIRRSVWWYPPDSVVDTATRVPVEEYLFMVGMTLLVGCWTVLVALPPTGGARGPLASWRRPVCAAGWLLLAGCGATAAALSPRALYVGYSVTVRSISIESRNASTSRRSRPQVRIVYDSAQQIGSAQWSVPRSASTCPVHRRNVVSRVAGSSLSTISSAYRANPYRLWT